MRIRHGYTARKLAELLEVSHTHILRMEKGEKGPSAHLILKISQVFNISADKLLRDDLELDD
ncbi:MAG: helix-turn-helix transcriptional regulator [Caldilineaceae bacterium]